MTYYVKPQLGGKLEDQLILNLKKNNVDVFLIFLNYYWYKITT